MPHFAMVVVVEADDSTEAHAAVTGAVGMDAPFVRFVGEPWEVKSLNDGFDTRHATAEFDTSSCITEYLENVEAL